MQDQPFIQFKAETNEKARLGLLHIKGVYYERYQKIQKELAGTTFNQAVNEVNIGYHTKQLAEMAAIMEVIEFLAQMIMVAALADIDSAVTPNEFARLYNNTCRRLMEDVKHGRDSAAIRVITMEKQREILKTWCIGTFIDSI